MAAAAAARRNAAHMVLWDSGYPLKSYFLPGGKRVRRMFVKWAFAVTGGHDDEACQELAVAAISDDHMFPINFGHDSGISWESYNWPEAHHVH